MIKSILQIFQDVRGEVSAMRVLSVLVVVDVMAVWSYKCLTSTSWLDIGSDTVLLIVGILGAKAVQRMGEK